MKKISVMMLLAVAGIAKQAQAQGYGGLFNSNYSPTNTVYFNPASIADARHKFQMNLFSANLYLNNTQGRVANIKNAIKNDEKLVFDIPNNNKKNNLDALAELRLPSFVATINPKHSIGFGMRNRTIASVANMPSELIYMYQNRIVELNSTVPGDFGTSANSFSEINASYGVVLMDQGEHVLKGGINAKYLSGIASASLYDNKDFTYEVAAVRSQRDYDIRTRNVDVVLNTSDANYNSLKPADILRRSYQLGRTDVGKGFGADIGFEYEWRPEHQNRYYPMDQKQQIDRSMIPYKLKVGAAVTDIGRIKYKGENATHYNIVSAEKTFNNSQINNNDVIASIKNIYASELNTTQGFTYKLPTSLNMNVDYNINNKFFVSANWMQGLTKVSKSMSPYGTFLSVVPRYEVRRVGVSLPVSYATRYSDRVNVGLAVRAGFFFIGTDDLAGLKAFNNKAVRSANIYFGVNFSIPHKRLRDKDGDGISDKLDKCPDQAGTLENKGCPWNDKDGDGVLDKDDKCPDQPGSVAAKGCPDQDNDGVSDSDDKCPEVAGLAKYQGCPDTDGDGVPDNLDKCPEKAGVVALQGCPDTDGDGVADIDDKCPEKAGPASNGGCPVIKEVKKVVTLTKVEEKVVFTAVQSLQFDTGKSTIKKYSYISLDNLAKLLNDKNTLTLTLAGHTDNVGGKALNQKLSEGRAKAVKTYLVAKGVDANRISAIGYGMSKPIASNATAAGRAKNRRVEFKVE